MPTFTDEMGRKLRNLSIQSGGHERDSKKYCIMEAVSYIAGQPHADTPVCVSEVITDFLVGINDTRANDKERNKLKAVVPEIMGTRPTEMKKAQFNYRGKMIDGLLEEPKYTKGYDKGETRRAKIVEAVGESIKRDDGYGYNVVDYRDISTREAIEVARKLAAVKNKA